MSDEEISIPTRDYSIKSDACETLEQIAKELLILSGLFERLSNDLNEVNV